MIKKKLNTPVVKVGKVALGGKNPIVIQSMTDTDTADAKATAKQAIELADAGAEMVRMTVNTNFAAAKVPEIRKILDAHGYKDLPLIGDFHFNGHILLKDFPEMAKTLDKYRINPGNVGKGDKNFSEIIKIAAANNKPVRIGVNWGSFDKKITMDAMISSAIRSAELAEKLGLKQNQIVLSVKMSIVQDMVKAYQLLVEKMQKNKHLYALHLGLTEAGSGIQGLISSSAALAILLQQGIGDTIRISLTPTHGEPRTKEVEACKTLLQSLGLRYFSAQITSCPGCGRTDSAFFQKLTKKINEAIEKKLPAWLKKYPQIAKLKIAIMGCAVNGPGEARYADIAISLPGRMEKKVAPVYIKGKFIKSLQGSKIPRQFIQLLEDHLLFANRGKSGIFHP